MTTKEARDQLRTPLVIWLLSRFLVVTTVLATALARGVDAGQRAADPAHWLVMRFAHWDSTLYGAIADRGYPAPGETCCYQAFFPGFPMSMRWLAPVFGGDYFWAGFAVVQLSALAAAVLLWRLARGVTGSDAAANWSVVAMAVFPTSLFLTVVYTEAPFLALSLAAWVAATRGHWWLASAAAALAGTVRINAVFLTAALLLMWWLARRNRRPAPASALAGLALGPAVIAAYLLWVGQRAGSLGAWSQAQREGWDRYAAPPWVALGTWWEGLASATSWHLFVARLLEGLATVAILVVPVVLARQRRWPEALLLGLNALTLTMTSTLMGNARYLLVWFPMYVLLGAAAARHPRRATLLAALSAIVMLGCAWAWGRQYWVA
ncbi:hypothetical protein ACQP1U_15465 [Actinomycetota bacterium]